MSNVEYPVVESGASYRKCPWCAEPIRSEALKCRHCGSLVEGGRPLAGLTQPWVRPREGRKLAGVCAGLAEQFGISVTLVRLAFVLGVVFSSGVLLIVYLALWVAMPEAPPARALERGSREDPFEPD
jgi:phage shock protein PspC (stress-responsive transcriptional regulator)